MSDCGAADGLPAWLTCQRWHLVGTGPIRGARLAPADFEDTGDVSEWQPARFVDLNNPTDEFKPRQPGTPPLDAGVLVVGLAPLPARRPASVADLVSAVHAPYADASMVPAPEMIPDHSDDIEFELIKPGWVIVPGSGRITVSAEARDRMVAAAMTWHRQHTVVPWHELISEARMRELVEAMLREAGDG